MPTEPKFLEAWKGTTFAVIMLILVFILASYFLQRPVSTDVSNEQTGEPVSEEVASTPSESTDTPSSEDVVVSRTTLFTGTVTCLPHKDTSGPQTMECAIGIEADDGMNYSLDLGDDPSAFTIGGGERIRVTGLMVPVEALSNNHWSTYDMRGIIRVETLERI